MVIFNLPEDGSSFHEAPVPCLPCCVVVMIGQNVNVNGVLIT